MFRFHGMQIWQKSVELLDDILDIADALEERKLYRFAEQLRGAALSITNNIAEGSGSRSDPEFRQFLNISKRSAYEVVGMLSVFYRRKYLLKKDYDDLEGKLEELCKMLSGFMKSL